MGRDALNFLHKSDMTDTSVIIAGGGPVGLMLALELDYHGVDAILLERNESTTRHPKMDITNGRSMEIFRRLGLVGALRDVAVPEDHPVSVIWCNNLAGWELTRFDYPSVQEARARLIQENSGAMAIEPSMRVSQVLLEPVLKHRLETSSKHVELRFGWGLEGLTQDESGVTAEIRCTATGERRQLRGLYLVGCDGASSVTRQSLGIHVNTITQRDFLATNDRNNFLDTARGEPPPDAPKPRNMFMIHWESDDLNLMERFGTAWHIQSPMGWSIISQNDKDTWTIHIPLIRVEGYEQRDPKEILFEQLGCRFDCEILLANPWYPRLGLADHYGTGRVWLAGDAVHQVIPTGGYGMNSGIGDALALGWVLGANVHGWGSAKLFNAYETERRHVAARNRIGSARHAAMRLLIAQDCPEKIHEDSEDGRHARARMGEYIAETGNLENEAWGLEWGYRYDDSPIICHEDGEPPPYEWEAYVPCTWPGARAPNLFVKDGTAIFDLFGREFTLLQFVECDTETLERAAASVGLPLEVVRIDDTHAAKLYQRNLVLVRPDQHVAWRGDEAPDYQCARGIFDRVRGA